MCPGPAGVAVAVGGGCRPSRGEAFVQVLTGEVTVVECADHWGVDRSTIMRARDTARRGALEALASSKRASSLSIPPDMLLTGSASSRGQNDRY